MWDNVLFRELMAVLDVDSITTKQACLHQLSSQCDTILVANGIPDIDWKKLIDTSMQDLLKRYDQNPEDKVAVSTIGAQVQNLIV